MRLKFLAAIIFFSIALGFLYYASPAFALTVSGIDGFTVCPFRNSPQKCTVFFKSISLSNKTLGEKFIDDKLDKNLKQTELGYIPKGSDVLITWSDYGELKKIDHYYLRYACAAKKESLNADNTEINQFIYKKEGTWSIPRNFDFYRDKNACYCKIWISAKQKGLTNEKAPTLGEANTRPFRICPTELAPMVDTLDPDYKKISNAQAVIEGNLTFVGRNEDREVFDKEKGTDVWFEYRYTEPNGTFYSGTVFPDKNRMEQIGKFSAVYPVKAVRSYVIYEYRAVANNKLSNGKGLVYGPWKDFILEPPAPPSPPPPAEETRTPCTGGSKNVLFIPFSYNVEVRGSMPVHGKGFEKFNFGWLGFGSVRYNYLKKFDTIVLQPQSCFAKSNLSQAARADLLRWTQEGGKLIIYDAQCGFVNAMLKAEYDWLGSASFYTQYPGADTYNTRLAKPSYTNWNKSNYPYIDLQILEEVPGMISSNPQNQKFVDFFAIASQTNAAGTQSFLKPVSENSWCANMSGKAFPPQEEGTGGISHAYSYIGNGMIIYNGLGRDTLTEYTAASNNSGDEALSKIFYHELDISWGKPECKLSCSHKMGIAAFFVTTEDFILNEDLTSVNLNGSVINKVPSPNNASFEIGILKDKNITSSFSTPGIKNMSDFQFSEKIPIEIISGTNQYFYRAKITYSNNQIEYGAWRRIEINKFLGKIFSPLTADVTSNSVALYQEVLNFDIETMAHVNFILDENKPKKNTKIKAGPVATPQMPKTMIIFDNLLPNTEYCYTVDYVRKFGALLEKALDYTIVGPKKYCFKTLPEGAQPTSLPGGFKLESLRMERMANSTKFVGKISGMLPGKKYVAQAKFYPQKTDLGGFIAKIGYQSVNTNGEFSFLVNNLIIKQAPYCFKVGITESSDAVIYSTNTVCAFD